MTAAYLCGTIFAHSLRGTNDAMDISQGSARMPRPDEMDVMGWDGTVLRGSHQGEGHVFLQAADTSFACYYLLRDASYPIRSSDFLCDGGTFVGAG